MAQEALRLYGVDAGGLVPPLRRASGCGVDSAGRQPFLGGFMDSSTAAACEMCGRPVSEHERDVRFRLPDPVFHSPEQHRAEGSWLSDPDPNVAALMQIPDISPFVRALLPVRLDGGHALRFGVWIAIHPDELQRAAAVWNRPAYSALKITGYLANRSNPGASSPSQWTLPL
ncbi:hypothetical protein AHiyo6_11590 [Arthrobacter sp. Hiyo6]|nr:hypothetical protein AHiyo6_11590 [Arthrobacter sp. Hiyo6]